MRGINCNRPARCCSKFSIKATLTGRGTGLPCVNRCAGSRRKWRRGAPRPGVTISGNWRYTRPTGSTSPAGACSGEKRGSFVLKGSNWFKRPVELSERAWKCGSRPAGFGAPETPRGNDGLPQGEETEFRLGSFLASPSMTSITPAQIRLLRRLCDMELRRSRACPTQADGLPSAKRRRASPPPYSSNP